APFIDDLWPGKTLYVHVVSLAVVAFAMIAFALRHQPAPAAAIGLVPPLSAREIGWGLLAIIPCYLCNIALTFAYVGGRYLQHPDVMEVAVKKVENMEVLGSISLAAIVPVSILVGIYEEVLFRGFFLSRLRLALGRLGEPRGTILAVVITTACFGLGHFYQGVLGVLQTTVVGLVLAIVAIWRRSIWACIIAHIGIDTFGLVVLKLIVPELMKALQAATQPA